MKAYGWAGLALLVVSEYFLWRKIEPFYSWFYCFAWWSYILLADNLLYRIRGDSLLTTRRREFWQMLPLSVFIWLLFEFYNLFIRNWAYDGVPHQAWLRWPGYFVAFATVLPGIFITSDLIHFLLFRRRDLIPPSRYEAIRPEVSSGYSWRMVLPGTVFTVAPLVWPVYFFPTVWLGPIFLLDPLLERCGIRSLSSSIASGRRSRVWSLMLAGLACGLLWEFWNFWAASKWIYRVPFFGDLKAFEMPILGFLGFPPFALECWILYHLLAATLRSVNRLPARLLLWLLLAIISSAVIHQMERRTILRFAEQQWTAHPWQCV